MSCQPQGSCSKLQVKGVLRVVKAPWKPMRMSGQGSAFTLPFPATPT